MSNKSEVWCSFACLKKPHFILSYVREEFQIRCVWFYLLVYTFVHQSVISK